MNTHLSRAMRELVAARPWLTVFQIPIKTRLRRMQYQAGLIDGESVIARAAAFLRAGDRVRPTAETTAANG